MTRTPYFALSALALSVALLSQPMLAQAQSDIPADEQALTELQTLAATESATQTLPSLSDLFARALRHDSDLTRQRYELDATREEVPMARSQLLPQVTASGGYLWQDSTNLQTVGDEDLGQPATRPGEIDETYYQVQLQQPLFSLERWRKMDVAGAQVSAAELELAVVEQELAMQVSEAYIKAYLAAQRLGLLEAQQDSLDLQVRQASRAFDLGVGNRVDLLEAQSRYDQAVADAVEAENELDNALSELERLTGVMPSFQRSAPGQLSTVTLDSELDDPESWIAQTNQT